MKKIRCIEIMTDTQFFFVKSELSDADFSYFVYEINSNGFKVTDTIDEADFHFLDHLGQHDCYTMNGSCVEWVNKISMFYTKLQLKRPTSV